MQRRIPRGCWRSRNGHRKRSPKDEGLWEKMSERGQIDSLQRVPGKVRRDKGPGLCNKAVWVTGVGGRALRSK